MFSFAYFFFRLLVNCSLCLRSLYFGRPLIFHNCVFSDYLPLHYPNPQSFPIFDYISKQACPKTDFRKYVMK